MNGIIEEMIISINYSSYTSALYCSWGIFCARAVRARYYEPEHTLFGRHVHRARVPRELDGLLVYKDIHGLR